MFFRFLATSLCLKEYINELSNLFGLKIRAVTFGIRAMVLGHFWGGCAWILMCGLCLTLWLLEIIFLFAHYFAICFIAFYLTSECAAKTCIFFSLFCFTWFLTFLSRCYQSKAVRYKKKNCFNANFFLKLKMIKWFFFQRDFSIFVLIFSIV
jgi:hypothetical protein